MKTSPKIKIYSGLSLDEKTAKDILPGARFSRPIRRGDLLGDVRSKFHVVCIIDGAFHHYPAVNCGEIMDALRAGMRIYGSSSMGALRASELDAHGMIGHGKIYEYVKKNPFFRDDYLGQTFEDEAGKLRASSIPYIDLFFRLKPLMEARLLAKREFDRICEFYRELHYTDRNLRVLFQMLDRDFKNSSRLPILKRSLARKTSQKRDDAMGLLRRIKKDLILIKRQNRLINS